MSNPDVLEAKPGRKQFGQTQRGLAVHPMAVVTPHVALFMILAFAAVAMLVSPTAHAANDSRVAHEAQTMRATDEARLHYVRHDGSRLFEEGTAHGTLPGSMRAECSVGASLSANFTIYTQDGTIRGYGTATPHGSGTDQSFAGTLTVTGGTGRYAHAHGHAGLYGLFNRRTYALTVQTTGSLSY